MPRPHHVFFVLSVAAILGGCNSKEMQDNPSGARTSESASMLEPDAVGTESPSGAVTQENPATPQPQETVTSEPQLQEAAPSLVDPCANATGLGTYKGQVCEGSFNFVNETGLSCQESLQRCTLKAAANPATSFYCTWNGRLIYRKDVTAGACNSQVCQSASGTATYLGYMCPSHNFIRTDNSSCQSALDNCAQNAALNPTRSIYCTWNGIEIYRRELTAGACNGLP